MITRKMQRAKAVVNAESEKKATVRTLPKFAFSKCLTNQGDDD